MSVAKVLLVEDDNNLREIYQARLTAEGYDIVAAQDGEEALSLAKQHHPDLIISDVMMPRISGFEMLDILRNTDELKNTKVIMLTALGQSEDRGRADNLGADKYLVKSQVTLEDIVAAAQVLLAGNTPEAASTPELTLPAAESMPSADATVVPATPEPAIEPPAEIVPDQIDDSVIEPPAAVITDTEPMQVTETQTTASSAPPEPPVAQVEPENTPQIPTSQATVPDTIPTESSAAPTVYADPSAAVLQPMDSQSVSPVQSVPVQDPDPLSPTVQSPQAIEVASPVSDTDSESIPPEPTIMTHAAPQLDVPTQTQPPVDDQNDALLSEAVTQLTQATIQPQTTFPAPSERNNLMMENETKPASFDETPQVQAQPPVPSVETPAAETFVPSPPPQPISAEPSDENGTDAVNVAGKKVIKPINDPATAPNIEELLAREVEKELGTTAEDTAVVTAGVEENLAPVPQPDRKPGVDPNSIAL